jgi:predicted nucleotidyltransferase
MRPSISIAEHGNQVREILERAGMRNAKVFGSTAHGEDTDDSDLDILVEAPPGTTLYDLARVDLQLEDLLGCKVASIDRRLSRARCRRERRGGPRTHSMTKRSEHEWLGDSSPGVSACNDTSPVSIALPS